MSSRCSLIGALSTSHSRACGHRATSRTASSARTASNASRSTACSRASGPAPRTWATKSSAICWSLRPASRRAYETSGSSGARSGSKTRLSVCGKRSVEPGHGVGRAHRVGEGRLDPRLLVPGQLRVGEQVLQRSRGSGRAPAGRGSRSARRSSGAVGAQVDEPHALAVVGLGEGVRQRGAGVADALGDGLAAVQMPERGVVDAVEDPGGYGGDPADGDVPLAVAGLAAGDEGVREDDGTGARRARRRGRRGPGPWRRRAPPRGPPSPPRTRPSPGPVRDTAVRRRPRRRARRRAPRACRSAEGSVRRWMPARPMSPAPTPRRRAESWFPEIITVGTPRSASRCRASSKSSTAASGGTARSYTSPDTTTASTSRSRTVATR